MRVISALFIFSHMFRSVVALITPQYSSCIGKRSTGAISLRQGTVRCKSLSPGSEVCDLNTRVAPPLKVMLFVDGTWLFYSLVLGREDCPVRSKFGDNWHSTRRIAWSKLPYLISNSIENQLASRNADARFVDVVRTSFFTSMRADTPLTGLRATMLNEIYMANFDLHRFVTAGNTEKCVDISLAVEMLYMATVPYAYDVAVIITGDKDFIPAMQKTRLLGKRVVLCSMRNSCNREMVRPEHMITDFDPIWLDDFIEDLIVAKDSDSSIEERLVREISSVILSSANQKISSRDLGRSLQLTELQGLSTLQVLKTQHPSLRSFLEKWCNTFVIHSPYDIFPEFFVTLADREDGDVAEDEIDAVADHSDDVDLRDDVDEINTLTVKVLQGRLRDAELATSGTKAVLVERLQEYKRSQTSSGTAAAIDSQGDEIQMNGESPSAAMKTLGKSWQRRGIVNNDDSETPTIKASDSTRRQNEDSSAARAADDVWTLNMVVEFLKNTELGEVSSRILGRYLQSLPLLQGGNALSRLKEDHGTLLQFLFKAIEDNDVVAIEGTKREFTVRLSKR